MWKEAVVAHFKVPSHDLLGGTEEKYGKPLSASKPRFESATSQT
jgi:hypothetical protein